MSETPADLCRWCGKPEEGAGLDGCQCFICAECDEPVIPGEGCACDFCGQCGQSRTHGDCECEDES